MGGNPFAVTNKEPVRLLLNATKAPDFGMYQASLNGVKLGDPLDFYDPKVVNQEFHLLDFGRSRANTLCGWRGGKERASERERVRDRVVAAARAAPPGHDHGA